MLKSNLFDPEIPDDNSEWAGRCEYWCTYKPQKVGRQKKFHYREPLILSGYGINLRVDRGTLFIRNGFTHYPQRSSEIRFFPGDPDLPDRIIIADGAGGISIDSFNWMAEQKIELVQLDWRGRTIVVGGNSGYSARPELVEAQRAAQHGNRQIDIARWLVEQKLVASLRTLSEAIPKSENRENSISRLERRISEIRNSRNSFSMPKIRGIEGDGAFAYFSGWHGLKLKWSGLSRRPIPSSWHEIGPRKMGWRNSGQNARHPINAMLNYGYAILVSRLRTQIVAVGFDPSIGVMHGNSQNRIPLVYDLMEPLRPAVDQKILEFALGNVFRPGDFTINKVGGCRLNPQIVRPLLGAIDISPAKVVTEYRQLLLGE